jgi:hypothetical protein
LRTLCVRWRCLFAPKLRFGRRSEAKPNVVNLYQLFRIVEKEGEHAAFVFFIGAHVHPFPQAVVWIDIVSTCPSHYNSTLKMPWIQQ